MLDGAKLLEYYRGQTTEMLTLLEELVKRESPSLDKEAVDRAEDWLETELAVLPVDVERLAQSERGDVLRVVREADGESKGRSVVLLTHIDTVWPIGELARRPFKVDGDRVTGPGCLDDKNGQVVLMAVLRGIRDLEIPLAGRVVALVNGDEEVGSTASASVIREEIRRSDYVLCMEATRVPQSVQTTRRAVGRFVMTIRGKASHSGAAPEKGVSAISELAEQIRDLHALNNTSKGISVNVGVVKGGERANIIAAEATAEIDLRAPSMKAGEAVARKILEAKPHREGITIEVTGGFSRCAVERRPEVVKLFELAKTLGGRLGMDLKESGSGGGSDACFATELGKPVLDGLGGVGEGGHSTDEYLLASSLAESAALVTLLVEHLLNEGL